MIELVENKCENRSAESFLDINLEVAKSVKKFHESFPMYEQTPLAKLDCYARKVGVESVYVKDESYRFGLNAFKVLGGSYAIARYIKDKYGLTEDDFCYDYLVSDELKKNTGDLTFITATDGNHGRGIAWTANTLKQKSVVLMPKGSAIERLINIRKEGATAHITEENYDDTVRLASSMATENGWILTQDTAWEGYSTIPTWIMQGYLTMAEEAYEQLNGVVPTHIFIQAGVGSLAASIIGFFADVYKKNKPIMTVVEPNAAACVFETAKANDGKLHAIKGEMKTIMAGLACGEPSSIGWEILKGKADFFLSIPDFAAAQGMRILGNPIGDDSRIISGESGASSFGGVSEILRNPEYNNIKQQLKLDKNSKILFFSTEGDTDSDNYRKIVWDGK